jgi:hypothetical protein
MSFIEFTEFSRIIMYLKNMDILLYLLDEFIEHKWQKLGKIAVYAMGPSKLGWPNMVWLHINQERNMGSEANLECGVIVETIL